VKGSKIVEFRNALIEKNISFYANRIKTDKYILERQIKTDRSLKASEKLVLMQKIAMYNNVLNDKRQLFKLAIQYKNIMDEIYNNEEYTCKVFNFKDYFNKGCVD
jgi:hypothetical protein